MMKKDPMKNTPKGIIADAITGHVKQLKTLFEYADANMVELYHEIGVQKNTLTISLNLDAIDDAGLRGELHRLGIVYEVPHLAHHTDESGCQEKKLICKGLSRPEIG